jgi:hypothetical protein
MMENAAAPPASATTATPASTHGRLMRRLGRLACANASGNPDAAS